MNHKINIAILAAFAFGLTGPAHAAEQRNIQWSVIPTKTITLFFPGQSTYEWLLSPAHRGSIRVAAGRVCVDCHEGAEQEMGDKLVKGGNLEPTPIAGKNGTIKLALQAAHDADYVCLRAQWKTNMNREGRMHDYVRFDGKQWNWYGKDRSDKDVRSGAQPALYEDRFSIMLDDGNVLENRNLHLSLAA